MKAGCKTLVDIANAKVKTYSLEEALKVHSNPDVIFVDIREREELDEEGKIPGALHAPRGMLEWYVDPESPYHKPEFSSGRLLILYCAAGLRSALAAEQIQVMGLKNVAHLGVGFWGWRDNKSPIEFSSETNPQGTPPAGRSLPL